MQPIPPGEGRDASVVEVTGVHPALQFVPAPGADRAWLVPAYAYETAEGALWGRPSVVAVVDELLAEAPRARAKGPASSGHQEVRRHGRRGRRRAG